MLSGVVLATVVIRNFIIGLKPEKALRTAIETVSDICSAISTGSGAIMSLVTYMDTALGDKYLRRDCFFFPKYGF